MLIEAYLIGGAAVVLYNHILLWQCARAAMRSLLIRWVVPSVSTMVSHSLGGNITLLLHFSSYRTTGQVAGLFSN